jgi:hypothetical protein
MDIFVVTPGSNNINYYQFAFYTQEEAEKLRYYLDKNKGGSSKQSTIHILRIYNKASQIIKDIE